VYRIGIELYRRPCSLRLVAGDEETQLKTPNYVGTYVFVSRSLVL